MHILMSVQLLSAIIMLHRDLVLPICLWDLGEIVELWNLLWKLVITMDNIGNCSRDFTKRLRLFTKNPKTLSRDHTPWRIYVAKNCDGLQVSYVYLFNLIICGSLKRWLLCNRRISAYCDMMSSQITAILTIYSNALNALRFISKQTIYFWLEKIINERNAEHQVSLCVFCVLNNADVGNKIWIQTSHLTWIYLTWLGN